MLLSHRAGHHNGVVWLHSRPIYEQFLPGVEHAAREAAEAAFPVLQAMPIPYVEAEDISNAVLYLASDESRYVTGMQLRVDGGAMVKRRPWPSWAVVQPARRITTAPARAEHSQTHF